MAKRSTVYESEMIVPAAPMDGSLDFITDRIREAALPVILIRFSAEDVTGMEAQALLNDVNQEIASRGLSTFPALTKRRRYVES